MDYLSGTNDFYSRDMLATPRYSRPYPNSEEAARAAEVLRYVGQIVETLCSSGTTVRILDVGSGRGWLTNLLSVFGHCEGVEPAEGAVNFARREFPELTFHCDSLEKFVERSPVQLFDIVVCSEVLEHVPSNFKPDFVRQLRATLKPEGHCIITTPRGEIFASYKENHSSSFQPVEDWLTETELCELFENRDFTALEHSRARPRRLSLRSRVQLSSKVHFLLKALGLAAIIPTLRYSTCVVQVWWFRASCHSKHQPSP